MTTYKRDGEEVSREEFYEGVEGVSGSSPSRSGSKDEDDDKKSSSSGGPSSSSESQDPRDKVQRVAKARGYYTRDGKLKQSKTEEFQKLYERHVKNPRELRAYKRSSVPVVTKPRKEGESHKEYEQRVGRAVRERAQKVAEKAAETKSTKTGEKVAASASLTQRRKTIQRQKAADRITRDLNLRGTDLTNPQRTLESVRAERALRQRTAQQVARDLGLQGTDLSDRGKTIPEVKRARDQRLEAKSKSSETPFTLLGSDAKESYEKASQTSGQTTKPQEPQPVSQLKVGFYEEKPLRVEPGETGFGAKLQKSPAGEMWKELKAGFTLSPSPTTNLNPREGFRAAITGRNPRTGRKETRAEQDIKSTFWLLGTTGAIASGSLGKGAGAALKTTKTGRVLEYAGRILQKPFARGGTIAAGTGSTALAASQAESPSQAARIGANLLKTGGFAAGSLQGSKGARAYARAARAARARSKQPVVLDRQNRVSLEELQQRAVKAGGKLELKVSPLKSIRGLGATTTDARGTVSQSRIEPVRGPTRTVDQIPKPGRYTLLETKTTRGVLAQPRPAKPGSKKPAVRAYRETYDRNVDVVKTSELQKRLASPRTGGNVVQASKKPSTTGAGLRRYEAFESKPYTFDVETTTQGTPIIQKKIPNRAVQALKGFKEYRYNFESGRQVAKGFAWDRADLIKKRFGVNKNPIYVLEKKPKVVPKRKGTSFADRAFERALERAKQPTAQDIASASTVASTVGTTGGSFLQALSQQARTLGITPIASAAETPTQGKTVASAETKTPTGTGAQGVRPSDARTGAGEIPVGRGPTSGVRPSTGRSGVVGGTPGSGVRPVVGGSDFERSKDSKDEETGDSEEVGSKPEKAESPAKLDPSSETRFKDIASSKTNAGAIVGSKTGAALRSDTTAKTSAASVAKTDAKTRTVTDTTTKTNLRSQTRVTPVTTTTLRTPIKGVIGKPQKPRNPPIPKIPGIPRRSQSFERQRRKQYQAVSKVRGRWQTIGRGFTKRAAALQGMRFTRKTPAATFGVREKDSKDFEEISPGRGFRRKKKGKNLFVEKTKYRIDTPGEFQGITYKGLRTSKKKKGVRKNKRKRRR